MNISMKRKDFMIVNMISNLKAAEARGT